VKNDPIRAEMRKNLVGEKISGYASSSSVLANTSRRTPQQLRLAPSKQIQPFFSPVGGSAGQNNIAKSNASTI
ncbi:hypothetical protein L0M85_10000, partial [Streptococcus sp. DFI.7.26]|uniref:hypothetical protein n=1 Tax=Streptococcus sp. DFI.7.26 TaxID=2916965 RepID=UPI001EE7DAA6